MRSSLRLVCSAGVALLCFAVLTLAAPSVAIAEAESSGDANRVSDDGDYVQPDMSVGSDGLELDHETINVQADQAISGERFIAVQAHHKPGAVEQLRPDLVALSNMAIAFLPATFRFRNVSAATRELINGVRYTLLANTADGDGSEHLCELVVLERPWLLAGEYDKQRELLHTNCTSGVDVAGSGNGSPPAIAAGDFNFNPLFMNRAAGGGGGGGLATDDLRQLEAQIVPVKPRATKKPVATDKLPAVLEESDFDKALRLIEADIVLPVQRQRPTAVREEGDFDKALREIEEQQRPTGDVASGVDVVDCPHLMNRFTPAAAVDTPVAAATSDQIDTVTSTTTTEALTDLQKGFLDAFFGLDTATETTEQMVTATKPPAASVEPTEPIAIVTPAVPTTEATTSPTPANNEPVANVGPIDVNGEPDARVASEACGESVAACNTERVKRRVILGGLDQLPEAEAKRYATAVLTEVAARAVGGTGGLDSNALQVVSVESATKQLVAGLKYVIDFTIADGQKCHTTIWSRLWIPEQPNQITCRCDNVPEQKFGMGPLPEATDENNAEDIGVQAFASAQSESDTSSSKLSKRSLLYDTHAPSDDFNSHAPHPDAIFVQFTQDFQRTYATRKERNHRRAVFRENMRKINELNDGEQGSAVYGVTQFADMTESEFARWTGLHQRPASAENEVRNARAVIPQVPVPREFDWRTRGVVTGVKNQGGCGSCWAFSVTGNIEGLQAIKSGKLEEYSEQELVDCDKVDHGCEGGLPDNAYKFIEELGGLELERDYPYSAKDGKCSFDPAKTRVRVSGAVDLPQNETAMAQYLIENGPLSIGINANAMQFYRGGVSHPWHALCAKSKIDHGVLIVGFGQSDYPLFNKTMPYWIVKNSWGPLWGEQGYYRVYRGDNTCGLNTMVSSAVLKE